MSQPSSLLLPSFLRRLADPEIKTVLLCGCGGGFDFVHGMALYPELMRLGKTVVIGSYSFGNPGRIGGDAPIVYEREGVVAKRVTARSEPDPHYAPEIHLCSYLDAVRGEAPPHFVYAYYARDFTVSLLTGLLTQLIAEHSVDAVVLMDGGSDSLMAGDEEGLGDPIEDAVSMTTVAGLTDLELKLLISVGLGTDRFNHVSDAASLRAIAELTRSEGFLGSVSLEADSECFRFYRDCVDWIDSRHGPGGFRSVLAGATISATEGAFGSRSVPDRLRTRVAPGQIFLWPLMAKLWAFDVDTMARRSKIANWIRQSPSVLQTHLDFAQGRQSLGAALRGVENLPRHEDARA